MNVWMDELDKRYKRKLERQSSSTPSKERQIGARSHSQPPPDAPKWTDNESWRPPIAAGTWFFIGLQMFVVS